MSNNQLENAELISKWVDVQSTELKLQGERLRIEEQELKHNHEMAKITLEKQAADRDAHRTFVRHCRRDTYLFISGIAAVIGVLTGTALYFNKDQVALEIIKAIFFIVSGGAGGYAIGKNRQDSD